MATAIVDLSVLSLGLHAMGTRCELRLAAPDGAAAGAMGRMRTTAAWFGRAEAELNRFDPASGLCRLNAAPAGEVAVSPLLAAALAGAVAMAHETGGLCHPGVLDCLEAAGYDRDLSKLPEDGPPPPPAPPPLWATCGAPGSRWLPVTVRGTRVTRPPGLRLDLGGTARGWAADRAVARLRRHGSAMVSLGGDLRAWAPPGAPPWEVAVPDPIQPWRTLALLHVRDAGVATSGTDRRWRRGGRWQHHIIDPRTGRAAASPVIAATVVAPTALQADAWAKAALLLGPAHGLSMLDSRGLGGLLVLRGGLAAINDSMRKYLHVYRGGPA